MNTIKQLLQEAIDWVWAWWQFVRFIPHFVVVAMRQKMGRWYYFRDRPDWVVDLMAELADVPIEEMDDDLRSICIEARAERHRRLDQARKASV